MKRQMPFPVMVAVLRRVVDIAADEMPGVVSHADQTAARIRNDMTTAGLTVTPETVKAFLYGMLAARWQEDIGRLDVGRDLAFAELAYGASELSRELERAAGDGGAS